MPTWFDGVDQRQQVTLLLRESESDYDVANESGSTVADKFGCETAVRLEASDDRQACPSVC